MINLKMEYLGLDVEIKCGEKDSDYHVNNRMLLGKIEDFLDQIHNYENVSIKINSKNSQYEDMGSQSRTYSDSLMPPNTDTVTITPYTGSTMDSIYNPSHTIIGGR